MLDIAHIARIQNLKSRVTSEFDVGDWSLLEQYLGEEGSVISGHPRLFRSLHFGDDDYPACVAEVIASIIEKEPQAVELIESMLGGGTASPQSSNSAIGEASFTVFPSTVEIDTTLVSVMIPFSAPFRDVREAMKKACESYGMRLRAADDVWNSSVLIKDIFDLIAKACIVIVDFTGKNPNVMYETGVAHALRKEVIPISQSMDDVPFDLKHHRILIYENDTAGREKLFLGLRERIGTILDQRGWK